MASIYVRVLDLAKLFDPSYDKRPPKVLAHDTAGVWVKATGSSQKVCLPRQMSGRLAYLIGVIVGDGYLSRPIRRKSHGPGFHWKLVITGPHDYVAELNGMFRKAFGISGGLKRDNRKKDSWQLRFSNVILHRFFARVIGLPMGKKTKHPRWSNFDSVKEYFMHFAAGLIDADGYIGPRYIGIVQKDFNFLVQLQRLLKETHGFHFHGPYVNKKIRGEISSWLIGLYSKDERTRLLRAKDSLNIG